MITRFSTLNPPHFCQLPGLEAPPYVVLEAVSMHTQPLTYLKQHAKNCTGSLLLAPGFTTAALQQQAASPLPPAANMLGGGGWQLCSPHYLPVLAHACPLYITAFPQPRGAKLPSSSCMGGTSFLVCLPVPTALHDSRKHHKTSQELLFRTLNNTGK